MKNLFTGITVIILIMTVIHYILLIMKIPSNINKIARFKFDDINRHIEKLEGEE